MAIDKFFYILFILVILIQLIDIDDIKEKISKKEKPLLILNNSVVYSIDNIGINKIIESKVFTKFNNKEFLEDATIVSRINNENINNVLRAKLMVKKDNNIELINDVQYHKGKKISLTTNSLIFNTKTKIITNKTKFNAIYNNNIFDGTHLYFDTKKNIIKSQYTHFNID
jgi:hypothetical protein